MMKFLKYLVPVLVISMLFISCKDDDDKDDEFPPLDRGNIEADAFQMYLTDINTHERDTVGFGYKSTNGNTNVDTIYWKTTVNALRKYDVEIRFFKNGTDVTAQIRNIDTKYINCYREFNTNDLRLEERDLDANSDILGLQTRWASDINFSTDGKGVIKITLNYQAQEKTNLCDSGIRIFEATVPYVIIR